MLSKKGLRKLEYNGVTFGWMVRSKPTYMQGAFKTPMTIAIQSIGVESPKVLYVILNIERPDNWSEPNKYQITPMLIKNIIEKALKNGWKHDAGGNAFEFRYSLNS